MFGQPCDWEPTGQFLTMTHEKKPPGWSKLLTANFTCCANERSSLPDY